jgi:hypothetical protein
MFAAQSRTRIANLRVKLANTKKEGKTTPQYFAAVKEVADELAAAGRKIEEDEIVEYLLAGLDDPYNPLFAAIGANPTTKLTVSELYAQVMAYDNRMEMLLGGTGVESSVNSAVHGRGNQRRGGREPPRGRGGGGRGGYGRGQGRPQQQQQHGHRGGNNNSKGGNDRNDRVVCQICHKPGHAAWKCWHRYSEDDEEEEDKEVHGASYRVDTNWYSDTGPTDHITSELDKLTMKEKYNGRDKIHAANGTGMNISNVGHAFVNSPLKQLHLHNVLHVPSATKNLVSIHRLTRDNNVFVEFHP